MRTIITTFALIGSLTLMAGATGCSKDDDGASCDKVADHYLEIMPAELKDQMGDKKALVAKCEKDLGPEDRKCALAAEDMAGIMKCAADKKKS